MVRFHSGRAEDLAVFTQIALWAKPYWDLVEWHVTLTWRDDEDSEAVVLHKGGTLTVPSDASPEDILSALARHLQQTSMPAGQSNDPSGP